MASGADEEVERHGERKLRENESGSVTVTIPAEAVENSNLTPGTDATIVSQDDGPVLLLDMTLAKAAREQLGG